MKAIKFLGQVLAALIYTPIYTGIMYAAIALPLGWIMSLSFWKMIFAIIVLGGLIEGLIAFLQMVGLFPFAWIIKGNKVSFWLSTGLSVLFPVLNIISLWGFLLAYGTTGVVFAIIVSIMLIQFICNTLLVLFGSKNDE